ncbi:MAG: hypothetical protein JRF63_08595 [Deltaproteobacteria bacterium]|nr:hypothetical protein [Deltaproteobacteria bacterium]
MDPLIIGIVAVAAILLLGFIYSLIVGKKGSLEGLAALPGETVLVEEQGVRVEQRARPKSALFMSCRLRVTDRRLIIAQKALLAKTHQLRFVFSYAQAGSGADLASSLGTGCIVADVAVDAITVARDGERMALEIPLGGGALTSGQTALIFTDRAAEIVAMINPSA